MKTKKHEANTLKPYLAFDSRASYITARADWRTEWRTHVEEARTNHAERTKAAKEGNSELYGKLVRERQQRAQYSRDLVLTRQAMKQQAQAQWAALKAHAAIPVAAMAAAG